MENFYVITVTTLQIYNFPFIDRELHANKVPPRSGQIQNYMVHYRIKKYKSYTFFSFLFNFFTSVPKHYFMQLLLFLFNIKRNFLLLITKYFRIFLLIMEIKIKDFILVWRTHVH